MTIAAHTLPTPMARTERIAFAGRPMGLELRRARGDSQWTWEIVGTCVARGQVSFTTDELVAFGARLAALIGGVRTSAELVSRCGRVRLAASADGSGYALAFRVGDLDTDKYSSGQMTLNESNLVRPADALLGLYGEATRAS